MKLPRGQILDRTQTIWRYLAVLLGANLAWEVVQLPLFTIWTTGTLGQNAFAVVHCTSGDVMIAATALFAALYLFGRSSWPNSATTVVYWVSLAFGIGYTIYSEWLNTSVRASWTYSDWMPLVPVLGTGVAPLLQWIMVPTLAMWIALGHAPWLRNSIRERS